MSEINLIAFDSLFFVFIYARVIVLILTHQSSIEYKLIVSHKSFNGTNILLTAKNVNIPGKDSEIFWRYKLINRW